MTRKAVSLTVIAIIGLVALNLLLAYSGRLILLNQASNEKRIIVQGDIEIRKGSRSCSYWTGLRIRTFEAEAYRWIVAQCPLIVAPGQILISGSDIIID